MTDYDRVAEPAEGGVTLKTLALSLDPAMRGWMNEGKSYIPPVGIGEVMRALDLDVPGLVSKEKSKQVLTRCIKSVHEGGKWLDRDLTVKTMSLLLEQQKKNAHASHLLTPREMTVARMVTEGWPNKKIATKLFISEGTAKLHLHHIYQKLNCPGRMSLQRYMQQHGLM